MRMQFAGFLVDSSTRQVLRDGIPIHLSPKALQLLLILIQAAPRALGKRELLERVWPETFVSESSLGNVVAELRRALRDRSPSGFVRTIHGFGYAFNAPLTAVTGPAGENASYRLLWGVREISLGEGINVLGRDRDSVAWIDAATVSRQHARIDISDGEATLEDLESKNGTYIGGERISIPRRLRDGDQIRLGRVQMTFRIFRAGGSTRTDAPP
jgi:DNA-binding winged helix-turn-helix (wHTH) protein